MMKPTQVLHAFYCSASEDEQFQDALDNHLSSFKRQGLLKTWSEREIRAGELYEAAIDMHLKEAHIVFCLVSPDFVASDSCYKRVMPQALERHKHGDTQVIPILIRPTYWENTPLSDLQMLPSNTRAVTSWSNHDDAWQEVVKGIVPIIKKMSLSLKTYEELLKEGITYLKSKHFAEALAVYERAIQLDRGNSGIFQAKSVALLGLKQYQEALEAAEQAIRLDTGNSFAFLRKSMALSRLKRYQEALEAVEQIIPHHPTNGGAFQAKGVALRGLKRYQEALEMAERAIQLDPSNSDAAMHSR